MAARAVSAEEVMAELGFGPDDPSLGRAMDESASLRLVIVAALEKWLAAHERRPAETNGSDRQNLARFVRSLPRGEA
jgi:hypothetical protein